MSQKSILQILGYSVTPSPPPPPPQEKSIPITVPALVPPVRFPITPSPTIPHPTLQPTTPLPPPPQLSAFSSHLPSTSSTMSTCHVIMSVSMCHVNMSVSSCHVIMSYNILQTKYDYQWIIYM
jgi:hypothetical protein